MTRDLLPRERGLTSTQGCPAGQEDGAGISLYRRKLRLRERGHLPKVTLLAGGSSKATPQGLHLPLRSLLVSFFKQPSLLFLLRSWLNPTTGLKGHLFQEAFSDLLSLS